MRRSAAFLAVAVSVVGTLIVGIIFAWPIEREPVHYFLLAYGAPLLLVGLSIFAIAIRSPIAGVALMFAALAVLWAAEWTCFSCDDSPTSRRISAVLFVFGAAAIPALIGFAIRWIYRRLPTS